MSFNTLAFLAFYPTLFLIYWAIRRWKRAQTALLMVGSWVFYGWWDWRYLGLLIGLTVTTFVTALLAGRAIDAAPARESAPRAAKLWTGVNIVLALGVLCVFKYFNFFSDNLRWIFSTLGWEVDWFTIEVLLPVGISFYTFQAISYSVDVCRGLVSAERDPIVFATYLAYFPQLVAGPIERASQLIPQLRRHRRWDYSTAVDGARQILWGFFKKIAVADACAPYVERTYSNVQGFWDAADYIPIGMGAIMFTLQIYCDFSGYGDIARGISRCLGIEIMQNFRFPFFSRSATEIWHRWNVSLSQWLRDYVYIPLGGSRLGSARTALNVMIVFALSGLWHGANWMVVTWGLYWGLVCGMEHLGSRTGLKRVSPYSGIPSMCLLMVLSYSIFRCEQVADMGPMFMGALMMGLPFCLVGEFMVALWHRLSHRTRRVVLVTAATLAVVTCVCGLRTIAFVWFILRWNAVIWAVLMLVVEWRNRTLTHGLERVPRSQWLRVGAYVGLMLLILTSVAGETNFIYYKF